jgi:hypothetical protein
LSEKEVLRELKKMSRVLLLANATQVERELGKIASTDDRKKIWVLVNGSLTSKEIADRVGITQRGVNLFLREAKLAEFIDYDEDCPRRILDYVPAAWIALVPGEEGPGKGKQAMQTAGTLDTVAQTGPNEEGH